MVKLNFKTDKPVSEKSIAEGDAEKTPIIEKSSQKQEEVELQIEEEGGELITEDREAEVSFESVDEGEEEKSVPKPSKKIKFKEEISDTFDDGWDTQYSGGGKKVFITLLIVIVVVAILVGGGYAIYTFTDLFKQKPVVSVTKQSNQTDKPEVLKETRPEKIEEKTGRTEFSSTPSPMLSLWQKNLGSNLFLVNHLQVIIAKKSEFCRFSLIVASSDEINLNVLSDSDDKIAKFKDDLNKSLPNLTFRTISTQVKVINRSRFTFADIRANIQPKLLVPSKTVIQKGAPSGNFNSDISNLIKQHKLILNQIKSGKTLSFNSYRANYFYLTITGSSTNLLNFLQAMANRFPTVQINKIALNPTNLITYSDNNLSVRINVLFVNPN